MTDVSQIDLSNDDLKDDGEADDQSIRPLANGEQPAAPNLNRAPEILRSRVEELRKSVNRIRWVQDADRGNFHIEVINGELRFEDDRLYLDSNGLLTIYPFIRPGQAPSEADPNVSDDPKDNKRPSRDVLTRFATLEATSGSHTIRFVSRIFAYEGGNDISVKAVEDSNVSGDPEINLNGNTVSDPSVQPGQDNIVIRYNSSHTIQEIIDEFDKSNHQNPPPALDLVEAFYIGSNNSDNMFTIPEQKLTGGMDGVRYRITASTLDSFFSTTENKLKYYGDTFALAFDNLLDRRNRNSDTNGILLNPSDLANLSVDPQKSAGCIPLCTRGYNDRIHFTTGFILEDGSSTADLNQARQLRIDLFAPNDELLLPSAGVTNADGAGRIGVDGSGFSVLDPNEVDNQTDNHVLGDVLDEIDNQLDQQSTNISGNDSDISNLDSRVTTNEGDINTLESDVQDNEDFIQYQSEIVEGWSVWKAYERRQKSDASQAIFNVESPVEIKDQGESVRSQPIVGLVSGGLYVHAFEQPSSANKAPDGSDALEAHNFWDGQLMDGGGSDDTLGDLTNGHGAYIDSHTEGQSTVVLSQTSSGSGTYAVNYIRRDVDYNFDSGTADMSEGYFEDDFTIQEGGKPTAIFLDAIDDTIYIGFEGDEDNSGVEHIRAYDFSVTSSDFQLGSSDDSYSFNTGTSQVDRVESIQKRRRTLHIHLVADVNGSPTSEFHRIEVDKSSSSISLNIRNVATTGLNKFDKVVVSDNYVYGFENGQQAAGHVTVYENHGTTVVSSSVFARSAAYDVVDAITVPGKGVYFLVRNQNAGSPFRLINVRGASVISDTPIRPNSTDGHPDSGSAYYTTHYLSYLEDVTMVTDGAHAYINYYDSNADEYVVQSISLGVGLEYMEELNNYQDTRPYFKEVQSA